MAITVIQATPVPKQGFRERFRMPRLELRSDGINMKTGLNTRVFATESSFWSTFATTAQGFREGAQLTNVVNGAVLDKLLDIQGESGIITHIISPETSSNATLGSMEILVIADGVSTNYKFNDIPKLSRAILGGIKPGVNSIIGSTAKDNTEYGSYLDEGWLALSTDTYNSIGVVLTPWQCLSEGIGIPYENSIEIYITKTVAVEPGNTYSNRAVVAYVGSTPAW